MGLFTRIWGRGYNDKVSIFLMANAICIAIIVPKLFPIPLLNHISMSYLAITFLLVNFRYKIISILLVEVYGLATMFYNSRWGITVLNVVVDNVYKILGIDLVYTGASYDFLVMEASWIIMRAFYIVTFIGYSVAILVLFFLTSIIIDWKFKIRKRAGLA